MTKDKLPRKALEAEKREFQWFAGYDRKQEYNKSPEWADDIGTKEIEESDGEFSKPKVRFYDKYDPEHMWIKSDTTRSLMRMI